MRSRNTAVAIGILLLLAFWFFFATNSSYQLSLKARFYESVGNYQKALELSDDALKLDVYNKMASATHANSVNALKFVHYITQGDEYLVKIRAMSEKGVSKADKERIKIMCEIMLDDFAILANVRLRDDELRQNSQNTYENFKKLQNELF